MYYKKNVNIYPENGKAVIRTWDKIFTISGGDKTCRLIREILTFCLFNRSEEEIIARFSYVNIDFLRKLIHMMCNNNILSDDRCDGEHKLSHGIISYIERNYKDSHAIMNKLDSFRITVISNNSDIMEYVKRFGFCLDDLKLINDTACEKGYNAAENEVIIADLCSGISEDLIFDKLSIGAGVICLYCTNDNDICATAFRNIRVLKNCFLRIPNSSTPKILNPNQFGLSCLLSSLMIIDNLLLEKIRNNVCIVRQDFMIDRCTADDYNYCSFVPTDVFPTVRNIDLQVITDELFRRLNNGCLPIGRIRYTNGEQSPFLTLQCDVFSDKGVKTVCESGENFTSAALNCFRSAVFTLFRGDSIIKLGCKEDSRIVVSYTGNAEDFLTEAAIAILKNEELFFYSEVFPETIKNLMDGSSFVKYDELPYFRLIVGGNANYSVYEVALISDYFSCYRSGNNISELIQQLMMNFSYAVANICEIKVEIDISKANISVFKFGETIFSKNKIEKLIEAYGYELKSEKSILENNSENAYIRKITIKKI